MNVNKVIKFYVLSPNVSILFSETNGRELKKETYNIFKTAFPKEDYYTFIFEDKQLFFDIISYNSTEMFGTCSEEEKINPTSFVRQRNTNTNETKPVGFLNPDEQLETYTYFYINFIQNRMTVIINKKIAKLHMALSQFIWEKSDNLASITILPEKISNMKDALKRFRLPKELELEYKSSPSLNDIRSLKDTLSGECNVDSYRINLKLSTVKQGFINKLIDYKQSDTDELLALRLTAKNELGLNETINFFEAIYSKTVPIVLSEDTVQNLDYIKELLKKYLTEHLAVPC